MKTRICSMILKMKEAYERRRWRLHKQLVRSSSLLSRRERSRRGRVTSMRIIRKRLLGRLKAEDERDIEKLDRASIRDKEDMARSLKCLREATFFLDKLLESPRLIMNAKFKRWELALDSFLSEARLMMDYRRVPVYCDSDGLDMLIRRIEHMRLGEALREQREVRYRLEDSLDYLFDGARQSLRSARRCNRNLGM